MITIKEVGTGGGGGGEVWLKENRKKYYRSNFWITGD
jgi:hypothetical protein